MRLLSAEEIKVLYNEGQPLTDELNDRKLKMVVRALAGLAGAVMLFALYGCASTPDPGRCASLKASADQACAAGSSNECTALALAYRVAGCGTYVPPPPPPTCANGGVTCAEGQECKDTAQGSVCVVKPPAHEPVCQPNQNCGCWVQPPGQDWVLLACSTGNTCTNNVCAPVAPTCPATCPSGQQCTDPAKGCQPTQPPKPYCQSDLNPELTPPVLSDDEWTSDGVDQTSTLRTAVAAAIKKAQQACGAAWANDQCLMLGVAGIDNAYRDVARELQGAGIVAAQGTNDANPKADHLTIGRPGEQVYEEWKLFAYTNGCLTQNQYKSAFRPVNPIPEPTPPPPAERCPYEPCPIRTWTADTLPPGWGSNELGRPAYQINTYKHTMGNNDSTAVVVRQEPFCRAIGLSPYADGQPRASCQVRPDGHNERVEVENWLLFGGYKRKGRNGQDCTPNNTDNPAAFLSGTGNCRMCNSGTGIEQTCTDWF
jgi:hypothetical protein